MIRKRKGFAILLTAVFSLGMLGGIPAYAEGIPEETIQQDAILAAGKEAVASRLEGFTIVKEIYVPKKIINIVVKPQ